MAQPPARLHFREQEAAALLDPIRLELARLDTRLEHYLARLILSDANTEALTNARAAIAQAAATIGALQTEAAQR